MPGKICQSRVGKCDLTCISFFASLILLRDVASIALVGATVNTYEKRLRRIVKEIMEKGWVKVELDKVLSAHALTTMDGLRGTAKAELAIAQAASHPLMVFVGEEGKVQIEDPVRSICMLRSALPAFSKKAGDESRRKVEDPDRARERNEKGLAFANLLQFHDLAMSWLPKVCDLDAVDLGGGEVGGMWTVLAGLGQVFHFDYSQVAVRPLTTLHDREAGTSFLRISSSFSTLLPVEGRSAIQIDVNASRHVEAHRAGLAEAANPPVRFDVADAFTKSHSPGQFLHVEVGPGEALLFLPSVCHAGASSVDHSNGRLHGYFAHKQVAIPDDKVFIGGGPCYGPQDLIKAGLKGATLEQLEAELQSRQTEL